jgi:Tol biopolymer transport system component
LNPMKQILGVVLSLVISATSVRAADDPLAAWGEGSQIHAVSSPQERHTIHTYYLTNPESPDGTKVLFYVSTTSNGQHGDLVVRERATGKETVIARDLDTEDAHRAACQQWISGGRRVAYHDVKNNRWSIHVVDLETLSDRKLAEDRQLCFGRVVDDLLPIYGCHWNPGAHRDLELLNAQTGEIRTAVTIAEVEKAYGEWLKKEFKGQPTSIFFPNLSPDGKRVFFKMASPGPQGAMNNYQSSEASHREGMIVYDLSTKTPLFLRMNWGHPAWHPDSRRIIEVHNTLIDSDAQGKATRIPNLPELPADHPSVSPDGKLFVMDGPLKNMGGKPGEWGVMVCDINGGNYKLIHRFINSRGATSWRKNHPHPVFSADGRRMYFNVNESQWTTLFVAEAAGPK